ENMRCCFLECLPHFPLGLSLLCCDGFQERDQGAIGQVGARGHVDDTGHHDRALPIEDPLLVIRVERPGCEPTTRAEAADGVGHIGGYARQVVETEDVSVVCGYGQVPHVTW